VTAPTYDTMLAALAARLSERSLGHSERVAATAAEIAIGYDIDADAARLAGLLHDWNRDISQSRLLELARGAGLPVTEVEEAFPYLLHGPLGALELAEAYPGLPVEVLHAIEVHTLGDAEMSPVARVVYVADAIEPGRRTSGVEELRALVGAASLDRLFAETYAASLRGLVDRRRRIHGRTLEVWNRIVERELL